MMNAQTPDRDRENPSEALHGRLREAVQRALDNGPPEELMRGALDRLRREGPPGAPARRPARRRVAWAIALAAAASVAGLILLRQSYTGGDGQPKIAKDVAPAADAATNGVEQPPTFWTYHLAARRSPEALDALLDEHAKQLGFSEPAFFPFGQSSGSQKETL